MRSDDDEPFFTWHGALRFMHHFFIVLGMIFTSICIGLYFSGFFTWMLGRLK